MISQYSLYFTFFSVREEYIVKHRTVVLLQLVLVDLPENHKHDVKSKLQVMSGTVTFASMNVQGMGDIRKRRDVMNLLKAKQYNIYCLLDTHLTYNDIHFTKSIWGVEC